MYHFEPGQKVRITTGIYKGRVVEIVWRISPNVTDYETGNIVNGYSVRGLTTPNATMSTFWDDGLEAI